MSRSDVLRLSSLLLPALLAGCTEQIDVVAPVRLDVRACLQPSAAHPEQGVCGTSLVERFSDGLTACLAWSLADQPKPALPFALRDGKLVPTGEATVALTKDAALTLKLFVLQPGQTGAACAGYTVATVCAEGDAATPASCLFALRPEQTRVSGSEPLDIVYGSEENPCGVECNDGCTPGDPSCRRLCWSATHPAVEACNGLDDDCDGAADEDFLVGQACDGTGECGAGTWECACAVADAGCAAADARWLQRVCSTEAGGSTPGGQPESCNGLDDNCDGQTDEDWPDLASPCEMPGECGAGTRVCSVTRTASCCSTDPSCSGLLPEEELCNGRDDNCDGQTDEGYGVAGFCAAVGECGPGTIECRCDGDLTCPPQNLQDARWRQSRCSTGPGGSASEAGAESCNGLDDDCDGQTDELWGELGDVCSALGACGAGTLVCNGLHTDTCCDSDPACGGTAHTSELCNGVDDDCDGQTDEEFVLRDLQGQPVLGADQNPQGVGSLCVAAGVCGGGVVECDRRDPQHLTAVCSTAPGGSAYDPGGPDSQGHEWRCDNLDNDCDGQTDEGFALNQACPGAGGVGSPCVAGVWECGPAPAYGKICSTHPGGSRHRDVAESCDAKDNDCDGNVDETFQLGTQCVLPGECGAGTLRCAAGGQTECSSIDRSAAEVCNGRDDNCDGRTDETWPNLGEGCQAAQGGCQAGTVICNSHGVLPEPTCCSVTTNCTGLPVGVEICDAVDNDCDGQTDEDFSLRQACAGVGGAGSPCVAGIWECRPGNLDHVCSTHPGGSNAQDDPEVCDGQDNDCDGQVDDSPLLPPATRSVGVCQGLTKRCVAGQLSEPVYTAIAGYEATEVSCDGLDNDCDGTVDAQDSNVVFPPANQQRGVCAGSRKTCAGAGGWTEPNYLQLDGYEVNETRCDGLDNDCDGQTDEGRRIGEACTLPGICGEGTLRCAAGGQSTECSSIARAVEERCDGLDNDCDSAVDETWTALLGQACVGQGACGNGVAICNRAGLLPDPTCCSSDARCTGQSGSELCDSVDNDCDGQTDEDFALTSGCPGVGASGSPCVPGVWECNAATQDRICSTHPGGSAHRDVAEVCDGSDNDCDGQIDDNPTLPPAGKVLGVCAGQLKRCLSGAPAEPNYTLITGYEATEASCDGLDNDCDGQTDEALAAPLASKQQGVCASARKTCTGTGGWQDPSYAAIVGYEVSESRCDGLDNDCDGKVDLLDSDLLALQPVAGKQQGVCLGVKKACAGAAGWVEPDYATAVGASYEPSEAKCDGLDNDCNGLVDLADASVQQVRPAADKQQGVCLGVKKNCAGAAGWQEPSYSQAVGVAYESSEGHCDALDNDCDGKTDLVDPDLVAVQPLAQRQHGVCLGAKQACGGATGWQEPNYGAVIGASYEASERSCDALDNDCDNLTDLNDADVVAVQPVAAKQSGVCAGVKKACGGSSGWQEPDYAQVLGAQYQTPERRCDGLDNDCDGLLDLADADLVAVQPLALRQQGVCAGARKACSGALDWTEPDYAQIVTGYQASESLCDGLDNDCDGSGDLLDPDVQASQPLAAQQQGVCSGTKKRCSGAQGWQEPDYAVATGGRYQASETWCDTLDNDCDSQTDEGFVLGDACAGQPDSLCGDGAMECACHASAGCAYLPTPDERLEASRVCSTFPGGSLDDSLPESCASNGIDDDCDGAIDNGGHCRSDCDLALHIVGPADLDDCDGRTFSRASVGTYLGYQLNTPGEIQEAPAGTPRWEHVPSLVPPAGEEKLGLLIEGMGVNLLAFTDKAISDGAGATLNYPWTGPLQGVANVVDNNGPAKDGQVLQATYKGVQTLSQGDLGEPFPARHTISFWHKRTTLMSPLVVGFQSGNATTITVTPGLSWARAIAVSPVGALTSDPLVLSLTSNVQGNGESVLLHGFQFEARPFASSYIRSQEAAGIRAADTLTVPVGLVNAAEGTYAVWMRPQFLPTEADPTVPHAIFLANGVVDFAFRLNGGVLMPTCNSGGRSAQVTLTADDWTRGSWIFVACSWSAGGVQALYYDGVQKLGSSSSGAPAAGPALSAYPAPRWALSRDIRLYRTAKSTQWLQDEVINQTKTVYGY